MKYACVGTFIRLPPHEQWFGSIPPHVHPFDDRAYFVHLCFTSGFTLKNTFALLTNS